MFPRGGREVWEGGRKGRREASREGLGFRVYVVEGGKEREFRVREGLGFRYGEFRV